MIVITGASGFIGKHLVEHLVQCDDLQIKALLSRNLASKVFNDPKIHPVLGDLMRPETLEKLFEPGCAVINLAYLPSRSRHDNLEAMANLADACVKAGIKRLIHCSTAVVAGRVADDTITEATPCAPASDYEQTKLEVERLLIDKSRGHFELAILRPTAVFGSGGKNLLKLAADLLHGNRAINYMKSCLYGHRKMNLVGIDNVTSAFAFLLAADKSIDRETFIISDDDCLANNYRDVEKYLMNALGVKDYLIPRFPLPRFLLVAVLRLAGQSNINPARVYQPGKLMAVGYQKSVSFKTGLDSFAAWYKKEYPSAEENAR